ncbi:MAG: radical SAM protein [Candidatus Diapherotrites archaeon]|nr:radical SAM protein [Candidatus Diapherotrites archaeon]
MRCTYCNHPIMKDFSEMTLEKGKELIDFISEFGETKLLITGGEPTTNEKFFELSKYAIKKISFVSLCTNGTLTDEKEIRKIANLGFSNITISADGHEEKTNDLTRGNGSFVRLVNFARILKEENANFSIHTVISKYNNDNIEEIINYWKEYTPNIEVSNQLKKTIKNQPIDKESNIKKTNAKLITNKHITLVGTEKGCDYDVCPINKYLFEINPKGEFVDCFWKNTCAITPTSFEKLKHIKKIEDLRKELKKFVRDTDENK